MSSCLHELFPPSIGTVHSCLFNIYDHYQDQKKTLECELARAKVTANRVAVVVANEWKDSNDKVMPVKQWLEERRFLQVG